MINEISHDTVGTQSYDTKNAHTKLLYNRYICKAIIQEVYREGHTDTQEGKRTHKETSVVADRRELPIIVEVQSHHRGFIVVVCACATCCGGHRNEIFRKKNLEKMKKHWKIWKRRKRIRKHCKLWKKMDRKIYG